MPKATASLEEAKMTACLRRVLTTTVAVGLLAAASGPAHAAAAAPGQKHFASAEDAVAALVAAAKASNEAELIAILGAKAKPILQSGDPVADREGRERFVAAYDEKHALNKEEDVAELVVGADDWPFPIPIVDDEAGWYFDTDAGDEEILARRIGRNELSTIQSCLAFVDAQREYYERNPDKDPLYHYARRFFSTEGKHDGLYWPAAAGEPESPLGEEFAAAKAEGYAKGKSSEPQPFHGYYYRILDGQGPHAPDGAYDYLVQDKLLGGFALVAWPASYGSSGIMTFQVNQDGVVHEKDLGPETPKLAAAIQRYDPDDSWAPVSEEDAAPETAAEAAE
jgi:hypothetical protein